MDERDQAKARPRVTPAAIMVFGPTLGCDARGGEVPGDGDQGIAEVPWPICYLPTSTGGGGAAYNNGSSASASALVIAAFIRLANATITRPRGRPRKPPMSQQTLAPEVF
jgi:hypothetical protein